MSRELTYDQMKALRAKEWARTSAAFAKAQAAHHAAILAMPDVSNAPVKGQPFTHSDLACPRCGFTAFRLDTWVTMNGVRYRTWLLCEGCHETVVWDWTERRWLA